MAHIRKLPNGRFEARYRAPDGRERSRRFLTNREAQAHLDQVGVDPRLTSHLRRRGAEFGVVGDVVGGAPEHGEALVVPGESGIGETIGSGAVDDQGHRQHLRRVPRRAWAGRLKETSAFTWDD